MNYMLVENNTLSSMKKEHFTYVKSEKDDKVPSNKEAGHQKNITCMLIIKPEDLIEPNKNNPSGKTSVNEYKKNVKFVTGSSDGIVKVWTGMRLKYEFDLEVSKYPVTALAWMKVSKYLVVATSDRMISFFHLNHMKRVPVQRIEDLVAVPLCLEYVKHKTIGLDVANERDKPIETLLWGDDLGIITMYNFMTTDWKIQSYKDYVKPDKVYLDESATEIIKDYDRQIWESDNMRESKAWKDWFDEIA